MAKSSKFSPFSVRYVSPVQEIRDQAALGKSAAKIKSAYKTLHTRVSLGFIAAGLLVLWLANQAGAVTPEILVWNLTFIFSWLLYLLYLNTHLR